MNEKKKFISGRGNCQKEIIGRIGVAVFGCGRNLVYLNDGYLCWRLFGCGYLRGGGDGDVSVAVLSNNSPKMLVE